MKIQNKLFLILFGFSFLLVTILVLLMQWSIDKGMVEYVNTKEVEILKPVVVKLAEEYQQENNWQSMAGQHKKFRRLIYDQLKSSEFSTSHPRMPQKHFPPTHSFKENGDQLSRSGPPRQNRPPPPERQNRPPPPDGEALYALLDSNKNIIVGNYPDDLEFSKTKIVIEDKIVGFFAVSKRNRLTQGYEVDFIEQQQNYLWIIALLAMIIVALVTLPLARHIVEPIKLIAHGMHQLTQGDYQQSIQLKRQDELGELSIDYNDLALTLSENEKARKRWLANISHELRTPVAILRGELEAMLDDVRPLTKSNIASANDEVKHLQRLIDDLHQLTSTDVGGMRYRKEHLDLAHLLTGELERYSSYLADAGISLSLDTIDQEINIYGDRTRLCQLFENIINNAIKYSKSTKLNISLSIKNEHAQPVANLLFEDNGIGVDEKHLANLFEYLYRVDDSRNRKDGGAGLGLSICRQIVMAHQGEISAQQADLGGLAIIIKLPIS